MDRYICVSYYNTEVRLSREGIFDKFRIYGQVENVLWDDPATDHFFVKFSCREEAMRCYAQRQVIFKEFGYIVELKGEIELGEDIERADSELPSIMDLNDDCLLHLLSYVQNEGAVKFVCLRFRRLLKELWKKDRHVSYHEEKNRCLDRLYHSGEKVTHLSVHWLPPDAHDVLFASCPHLKYLGLFKYFKIWNLRCLTNISQSVTELEYDQLGKKKDIMGIIRANNLELNKLLIFGRVISYHKIAMMSSLTTLLILRTPLDVGQILRDFPQLFVLGCSLVGLSGPIPVNNSLQALYVSMMDEYVGELLKIRKSCKELRHLRVDDMMLFEHGILRFLPLDGLHLIAPTWPLKGNELSRLADDVKILFLSECGWKYEEYALILSKFKKLEITRWKFDDSSFDWFLTHRLEKLPLKFVAGCYQPTRQQKMTEPTCKWYSDSRSIFGPFSIYSSDRIYEGYDHYNRDEDYDDPDESDSSDSE